MQAVIESIAAIGILVALGYVLRRWCFRQEALWSGLEGLTYYLLFPALLFRSLAATELELGRTWPLIVATVGALLAAALAAVAVRLFSKADDAHWTSAFQSAVRFNTYIILAAVSGIVGPDGVATASVALGALVIVSNLVSVAALAHWSPDGQGRFDGLRLVRTLARNPLIIACVAGLAVNLAELPLPGPVLTAVGMAGQAALAAGLLVVGAALRFRDMPEEAAVFAWTAAIKLAGQPLVFLAIAYLLGIGGSQLTVGIVCAAVPPATSSYILARQLGGDAGLMARLISMHTLAAVLTLPFWLYVVG